MDKVVFQGFVSGVMAASSGVKNMAPDLRKVQSKKRMPIWDRLVSSGLLQKSGDLKKDGYEEFWLTKKGAQLANSMIDDGSLYNPNKIRFIVR